MLSLDFVVRLVEPSKLTKNEYDIAEGFIEAVFHSHKETDLASFLNLLKFGNV